MRLKYGEKVSDISPEEMFAKRAIREASHAVVSKVLMPNVSIKHIAVAPRNNAKDFVANSHDDSQNNMTSVDIKNRICVSLSGRIAQIKQYGETVGMDIEASADLQQATKDAYRAIAYYGMDKEVGYININGVINAQDQSKDALNTQHYHEKIDAALERWMAESEKNTIALVDKHWGQIEALATTLLDKEIMYSEELNNI